MSRRPDGLDPAEQERLRGAFFTLEPDPYFTLEPDSPPATQRAYAGDNVTLTIHRVESPVIQIFDRDGVAILEVDADRLELHGVVGPEPRPSPPREERLNAGAGCALLIAVAIGAAGMLVALLVAGVVRL